MLRLLHVLHHHDRQSFLPEHLKLIQLKRTSDMVLSEEL